MIPTVIGDMQKCHHSVNPLTLSVDQSRSSRFDCIYEDGLLRRNLCFISFYLQSTADYLMLFSFLFAVSLLRDLKHANIVTLHDIIHTQHTLTLVFEYLVSRYRNMLNIVVGFNCVWACVCLSLCVCVCV